MKKIVIVSTKAKGGISSVVESYINDGLYNSIPFKLLSTHSNAFTKHFLFLKSLIVYLYFLITGKVLLLHCHSSMRGSFWRKSLFSLVSHLFNVPIIFHLHGSEFKVFYNASPKCIQKIISWIFSKQTVVLVLSQSWREFILSISPKSNVIVQPNYVNLPDLSLKKIKKDNVINVLFLGEIGKRKGVYDLLPAFKQALEKVPTLTLTLAGDGETEKAKKIAKDLGIENSVNFPGWVSGEQKTNLLSNADIYVLPSYNEGLPVSVLEAMSWQLPVITTKVGGIPELISNNQSGILIEAGDVQALTTELVTLASDKIYSLKIASQARKEIECSYSSEINKSKLKAIYNHLINKS